MKKLDSFVDGFSKRYTIVHQVRIQSQFNFDPDKLCGEIESRCRAENVQTVGRRAAIVHIERDECRDRAHIANAYILTFAYLDSLDHIYATIEEIEKDVERARSIRDLLDLVVG